MGAFEPPLTIDAAFRQAREVFKREDIPTADLDASLLLEHACGATRLDRITNPDKFLTNSQIVAFREFVERRIRREPVHRIIGHREFYGLALELGQATLIPRPDTEILVDMVLPFVKDQISRHGACSILDLGTGTGAIALAILSQEPNALATGVDLETDALHVATKNAKKLGLEARFTPLRSNWFEAVSGQFDLIVSNPPYIATNIIQQLDIDVRIHDPVLALDGGTDGLDAYKIIAQNCAPFLKSSGRIAVEIGYDQKLSVTALFEEAEYKLLEARNDLNGQNRAIFFA